MSRPLFIYVKKQHMDSIAGMKEFIAEYASDKALGPDGYLADKGLITLPADQAKKSMEAAKSLAIISADGLK